MGEEGRLWACWVEGWISYLKCFEIRLFSYSPSNGWEHESQDRFGLGGRSLKFKFRPDSHSPLQPFLEFALDIRSLSSHGGWEGDSFLCGYYPLCVFPAGQNQKEKGCTVTWLSEFLGSSSRNNFSKHQIDTKPQAHKKSSRHCWISFLKGLKNGMLGCLWAQLCDLLFLINSSQWCFVCWIWWTTEPSLQRWQDAYGCRHCKLLIASSGLPRQLVSPRPFPTLC